MSDEQITAIAERHAAPRNVGGGITDDDAGALLADIEERKRAYGALESLFEAQGRFLQRAGHALLETRPVTKEGLRLYSPLLADLLAAGIVGEDARAAGLIGGGEDE